MQEVQLKPVLKRDFAIRPVRSFPEASAAPIETTPYTEPIEEKALYVEYFRTLLRHKRLIGWLVFAGVALALLFHLRTDPLYRSRTSLDIQSLNGDFMNLRSIDPMGDASSSDTNVQTQIKLLQSDSLTERVQQHLLNETHPAFYERKDLLSRIQRTLHLGHPQLIPFSAVLDETSKQTKVKPLGVTRLVEVTCASWDPAFASKYCNTLTSEFEAEDLDNRGSEAKQTSEWLMHQAADVKQKSEQTEKNLFAATGGNGLILSQQSDTVGEDRLRQLQSELVKAQADRMEKEAQTVVARNASANSTPSVVSDPSYAASRTKLADLEAQVAAIVPPLTEENPKVIKLRAQIKQLQDNMAVERSESAQRLQNEFAAAKHRETLLELSYKGQEQSVSADMQKGSQVALLRRELESEQQLYQTLLQKAKEAGFASAMHASTIRVVDPARTPKIAAYPQRLTTTVVGAMIGLVVGVGFAFFRDRHATVIRTPGEASRFLHIEELGVIPSPLAPRSWAQLSPLEWTRQLLPTRAKALLGKAGSLHIAQPLQVPSQPEIATAGWDDPFSLVAEAYRNATLSILVSGGQNSSKTYIISSPNTGEGKTTVTTNLGIALSRAKLRVAIVDGDMRRPTLHRALGISNRNGLRNVLNGDFDVSESSLPQFCLPTSFHGLHVVPSGSSTGESGDLLHSRSLQKMVALLKEHFDIVLIDTPPALHMIDARILAGQADGAILVMRSGKTTREAAASVRDLFLNDRTPIIGTILNDFDADRQGHRGYYASYYSYHNGARQNDEVVSS